MSKRALVFGVSGQDGALMSALLLKKGYKVWGTTRNRGRGLDVFRKLHQLNIQDQVELITVDVESPGKINEVMTAIQPDEIYFLAGQSSVGRSFMSPNETIIGCVAGALSILEACRKKFPNVKSYFAASSEAFGDLGDKVADENTPLCPINPYGVAKAALMQIVRTYRENYNLYACAGILYNHESLLRPESFVTQKIMRAAGRISEGASDVLKLGSLDVIRDFGWAEEFVVAKWLMLQQDSPKDFVLCTGKSYSLRDWTEQAFGLYGLDWRDHVEIDPENFRKNDIKIQKGNPGKAHRELGWSATSSMPEVLVKMKSKT